MSELNLCSRREADVLIDQGRVRLRGELIEPTLGQKVNCDEIDIAIVHNDEFEDAEVSTSSDENQAINFNWQRIRGDTVVIHKPVGYVSGQPDPKHGHLPAVQLLTRENIHLPDKEVEYTLRSGKYLNFAKKFHNANDTDNPSTLLNYAPAGRLDLDSSGVLIMTKNGVLAKTILSGQVHKEYIVKVEPAHHLTSVEKEMGLTSLPYPRWDLSVLLRGGKRLWNDRTPLKPLVEAEWVEDDDTSKGKERGSKGKVVGEGVWTGRGVLRLVLKEGKKRQIRRMCREILGLHVLHLERVRVGSVNLENLPYGKWRPLREKEVRELLVKV
jgi:23S rRNA pseudouridine2604 synthase